MAMMLHPGDPDFKSGRAWLAVFATSVIGITLFFLGGWLATDNRGGWLGVPLMFIGGVSMAGAVFVGELVDDRVAEKVKKAELPGAAQEEQALQAIGPGLMVTSDPTLAGLLQAVEKMERRMARLTWVTCVIGLIVTGMCAIFAEQLGHLSH
jgi:hypothetical protein